MSALKDIYSAVFYDRLAKVLENTIPSFDSNKFRSKVFVPSFENMELKERMRHTTLVLHEFMPDSYADAVQLIFNIIEDYRNQGQGEGLAFIFLPDYLEVYGINHYETSMKAMEFVTQFISCEFAIRPFIIKYFDQMMVQMKEWSLHTSPQVRRLASEGSRPRLPWAMAIPELKRNPAPILLILDNLKNDTSEVVRRSVANSLNDISKDNPQIVFEIAKKWSGQNSNTDAIVKHGSRTLLKQGHTAILDHYGLNSNGLVITDFEVTSPQVKMGNAVAFSFVIENATDDQKIVRLEYGLYYNKANGKLAKKVFKISERIYKPHEIAIIKRKQSFKLITTRVFYSGHHQLSLIINGIEQTESIQSFDLTL